MPDQIVEFKMSLKHDFMPLPIPDPSVGRKIGEPVTEEVLGYLNSIPHILQAAGVVNSISEGNRLLKQGAIERSTEEGFEKINDQFAPVYDGMVIRVGKHRFLRIVDADKQSGPSTDEGTD